MEDSFSQFHLLGSDCFKFHHVFMAFTLTEFLLGPGKNGCVVQLIICSKCRTCPSFMPLFYGMIFCLSVCLFICCISFVYCPTACSGSTYLKRLSSVWIENRWEKMKGENKGKKGEKGRRWEDSMCRKEDEDSVYVETSVAANYFACLIKSSSSQNWQDAGVGDGT